MHTSSSRASALAFLVALLAAPLAAHADDAPQCRHTEPRELAMDFDGVRVVRFETGNSRLRIDGASRPDATLRGRVCASSASALASLTIDAKRAGEVLTVTLGRTTTGGLFGSRYAYLDVAGQVPADALVQVVVGSGDAWVTGVAAASADVGSGDAELRRIAGRATVKTGSGDILVEDAGELKLLSVGSGDVVARGIRDSVEVGSIGSGDVELHRIGGDIRIGSIGSGDVEIRDAAGSVRVGSIGSGDLDAQRVDGDLTVSSKGSGDIVVREVRGTVDLPPKR
ncbi:DUF2807 domain-containing protein [Luteimonas sp. S4-F44]|uniref:DUF2807 domain-containing protein n=1 Tax=Luteimonas sp. S4-F44 TaxID=2925842 RepID=UPI001F52D271|nr:DUF2807 domain-containing protein [Luteimonas sp. S4-F44]UNK43794.1 DUF2807 domain-containing protein [Luteimonas sp. S4-F44]